MFIELNAQTNDCFLQQFLWDTNNQARIFTPAYKHDIMWGRKEVLPGEKAVLNGDNIQR